MEGQVEDPVPGVRLAGKVWVTQNTGPNGPSTRNAKRGHDRGLTEAREQEVQEHVDNKAATRKRSRNTHEAEERNEANRRR